MTRMPVAPSIRPSKKVLNEQLESKFSVPEGATYKTEKQALDHKKNTRNSNYHKEFLVHSSQNSRAPMYGII